MQLAFAIALRGAFHFSGEGSINGVTSRCDLPAFAAGLRVARGIALRNPDPQERRDNLEYIADAMKQNGMKRDAQETLLLADGRKL